MVGAKPINTHTCSNCGAGLTRAQVDTGICYGCGVNFNLTPPKKNRSGCWLFGLVIVIFCFQQIALYLNLL